VKNADRSRLYRSIDELVRAVTSLVETIEKSAAPPRAGRATPPAARVDDAELAARKEKIRRAARRHWAKMTPEQHRERVRKMLAGRGLKPKRK
jgi:hypothetical protein